MRTVAYSREIYDQAYAILERRRGTAQARAAALRAEMTAKVPRLAEIEHQMAQSAGKVVHAILSGENVDEQVEHIKTENLALQAEMAKLLRQNGVQAENFEPRYHCAKCEDTGVHDNKHCECFLSLLRELSCESLSELSGMKPTSFDDLSLEYYPSQPDAKTGISPRARMRGIIDFCRTYAEQFAGAEDSLLLSGPTGIGKTHLSLAIAGEVLARGYSVVYGPVQKLLHRLEKEHFGRVEGNSEDVMTDCDLLILDDVGTEFNSAFYTAALYNIINERMLLGKPTIISTNLDAAQMMTRYGEQIASRVIGTFRPLACAGKDIRQLKLKETIK